jgi:hypothetical protein
MKAPEGPKEERKPIKGSAVVTETSVDLSAFGFAVVTGNSIHYPAFGSVVVTRIGSSGLESSKMQ